MARWSHGRRELYARRERAGLWFCEGAASGTPFALMAMDDARARAILAHYRLNVIGLRPVAPATTTTDRVWIPPPPADVTQRGQRVAPARCRRRS